MFFPVSTDSPIRRTPVVNYGLIALNVLLFVASRGLGGDGEPRPWVGSLVLQIGDPGVLQFFGYQFLHADAMHLIGNMVFLWVFGNPINGSFGHLGYLMFYLAGGILAGLSWAIGATEPQTLIGASGAVAAVTTAYLALFPRNHVRVIYILIFIGFIELPTLLFVMIQVLVLNIVLPSFQSGPSQTAYAAHLGGYAFGFVVTLGLLLIRALPRDHFDLLALMKRWNQRRAFADAMRDPTARATAELGRVARPIALTDDDDDDDDPDAGGQIDKITELRSAIAEAITGDDSDEAVRQYLELVALDAEQVLPRRQQLDVGNHLYKAGQPLQAAAAYERFLHSYAHAPEASELRLLLGIVYARDLHQYEAAERHLQDVKGRLNDDRRIAQHEEWLSVVLAQLGRPTAES